MHHSVERRATKKCEDMCSRLDTLSALERRTDGRTEMVKQYRDLPASILTAAQNTLDTGSVIHRCSLT